MRRSIRVQRALVTLDQTNCHAQNVQIRANQECIMCAQHACFCAVILITLYLSLSLFLSRFFSPSLSRSLSFSSTHMSLSLALSLSLFLSLSYTQIILYHSMLYCTILYYHTYYYYHYYYYYYYHYISWYWLLKCHRFLQFRSSSMGLCQKGDARVQCKSHGCSYIYLYT